MAIKGTGFDNSSIKNVTVVSGDTLEVDGSITSAEGLTVTAGGASITGNSSISGNLTVSGTLISQDEQQTLVKDNFLDINFGYTGTNYEQSGLTFNYQATSAGSNAINTSTNNVQFTAGSTSARAKFTVADSVIGGSAFSELDLIQISGTTNSENDGIYVVKTCSANSGTTTVEIESNSLTVPDAPDAKFALLGFTTQLEDTVTNLAITGLNVMALRSSSTGVLQSANGSADGSFATYTNVGAATGLQVAYETTPTITTASNTDIAFTLTSGNFTVDSGSISFGVSSALSSFAVGTNGNSGGDLVLSEAGASGSIQVIVNSGTVLEAKSGGLDLNTDIDFGKATGSQQVLTKAASATGDDLKIALTGAQNASIILDSAGTGNDAISLNASAGGFDIAGAIDSKILVTTGALNIGTDTSGDFTLSTTTAGDIIVTSAEKIDIDAVGAVTVDAASFSIDGTSASNVTATGANLTLSTLSSGSVIVSSAGLMDFNASANLDIDVTGTFDVLASGAFSIDGTGASNVSATSGNLTLSTITSGVVVLNAPSTVKVQSGGADKVTFGSTNVIFDYQIQASSTGGFKFGVAGQNVTSILDEDAMTTNSATALATQQSIKAYVDSRGISNFASIATFTADEAIAVGKVVAIKVTGGDEGRAILANATAASTANVIGICISAAAGQGNTCIVAQVGTLGGLSSLTAGNKLYASTTAGGLTASAPSGSGNVVFQIGYAKSSTEIIVAPQFIMEIG